MNPNCFKYFAIIFFVYNFTFCGRLTLYKISCLFAVFESLIHYYNKISMKEVYILLPLLTTNNNIVNFPIRQESEVERVMGISRTEYFLHDLGDDCFAVEI